MQKSFGIRTHTLIQFLIFKILHGLFFFSQRRLFLFPLESSIRRENLNKKSYENHQLKNKNIFNNDTFVAHQCTPKKVHVVYRR